MQHPTHALIITRDDLIQNLLEQVLLIRDIQIVTVATVQEAEAIVALSGLGVFGLVIIDTAALGENEADQQHESSRVVEAWTAANPSLPFILLGTFLQKHGVHMIRSDRVYVLVKPFRLDELVDAIDQLYRGKRSLNPFLPRGSQ